MKADFDDSVAKLSQLQDLLKASDTKSKELEARLAGLVETNKGDEAKIKELMADMKPYDQRTPEEQIAGEVCAAGTQAVKIK